MKFTILFFRAIRLIEDQAAKKRRRKGIGFHTKKGAAEKKVQSINPSLARFPFKK